MFAYSTTLSVMAIVRHIVKLCILRIKSIHIILADY